jgi:hypothetical protein
MGNVMTSSHLPRRRLSTATGGSRKLQGLLVWCLSEEARVRAAFLAPPAATPACSLSVTAIPALRLGQKPGFGVRNALLPTMV